MKVGFCTGVFDLFHAGHKHFLDYAALRCDYLIVAVNQDKWCRRKASGRPFNTLAERMYDVSRYVDYKCAVIPFDGNDLALAAALNPDVVFRGWDQREDGGLIPIIRIGQLPGFSTTLLASQKEST